MTMIIMIEKTTLKARTKKYFIKANSVQKLIGLECHSLGNRNKKPFEYIKSQIYLVRNYPYKQWQIFNIYLFARARVCVCVCLFVCMCVCVCKVKLY